MFIVITFLFFITHFLEKVIPLFILPPSGNAPGYDFPAANYLHMTLELKTRRPLELTSQREKVSLFVFVQHFLEQVIYVENLLF